MTGSLRSASVPTPVGPFTLVASDDGVHAAGFTAHGDRLMARLDDGGPIAPHRPSKDLGEITDALHRYLAGDMRACDSLIVAQPGGPFLIEAWNQMRAIPAGNTITYRELATRAGRPEATRAAGTACAANRVALIVPCHRVVRTGGGLGGYLWGLPVKRWLLAHEGALGEVLGATNRPAQLAFPSAH